MSHYAKTGNPNGRPRKTDDATVSPTLSLCVDGYCVYGQEAADAIANITAVCGGAKCSVKDMVMGLQPRKAN